MAKLHMGAYIQFDEDKRPIWSDDGSLVDKESFLETSVANLRLFELMAGHPHSPLPKKEKIEKEAWEDEGEEWKKGR